MINKYIKEYLNLFENLSLTNLRKFDKLIDKNIIFIDPFNNVKGKNAFKNIFKNTLTKTENPKFKVEKILSKTNLVFVKWEMTYIAFGKTQKITGLSEIVLNEKGKIKYHFDYWDSFKQFYLKIPVLGKILKIISNFIETKI